MASEDRVVFEEQQAFAAWGYAVIAGIAAIYLFPPFRWPLNLIPIAAMGGICNLLAEHTTVTDREVRIRFGYVVPFYVRSIPLTEIEAAEPVAYSPLRDYGGWGIRGFGANVALNARGDRGVRLALTGGRTLLIGSQRPNELAVAIREAKLG